MNERERAIIRLALANLERSIAQLASESIPSWRPPLTSGEVSRLRRTLYEDDTKPALHIVQETT